MSLRRFKLGITLTGLVLLVRPGFALGQERPSEAAAAKPTPGLPAAWVNGHQWRSIGPANMGGRITAIAVYEKDPTTWWVATASGGLLKTTNNAVSFEHQFDHEATVSIGDVAVAQSDPNIVWVGTGEANPRNSVSWGDGVYKSTDGGKTWKNMGLKESFQIGQIAIHPEDPNIVYVGALGRLWGPNEERGLYKTTDGGETWERVLYVDDKTGVIDVQMHPEDPDTLLAATYERQRDGFDTNDPAKKWGEGSGLYKSTNGGKKWTRIRKGLPSGKLGRIGIDFYRKDPDVVYVVLESELIGKEPEDAAYGGFRGEDADAGARLTAIVEEGPAEKAGLKQGDIVLAVDDVTIHSYNDLLNQVRKRLAGDTVTLEVSRERKSQTFELALTRRPENEDQGGGGPGGGTGQGPERGRFGPPGGGREITGPFGSGLGGQRENVHEQQGPEGHEFGGVYRSEDAGSSWTRINSVNPRPMYFSEIRVDPSDENFLYVLGVSLYRSKDRGATFTADGGRDAHPDHHALWVDPNDGRHMILGNDGGIYVSYDRMDRWDHLNHAAIGQFYHVAVDSRRDYKVYGGLQDNGSWGGPGRARDGGGPINEDWFRVGGGDGFVCLVDPEDPDQVYFESQNGGMGRINLRTGERGGIRPRPSRGVRYRFNWRTPFVLSHHNTRIYYTAGNHVFRSLNRGSELKQISPEITRTDRGSGTALAESFHDPDVLYVGTDDGAFWVTRDGGHEWEKILDFGDDQEKPAASEPDRIAAESGERAPASEESGQERRAEPERTERAERSARSESGRERQPAGGGMMERFRQMDADGDGKISRDEAPERMEPFFDRLDENEDGFIDRDELEAMAGRFSRRGPQADRSRPTEGDEPPPERSTRRRAPTDRDESPRTARDDDRRGSTESDERQPERRRAGAPQPARDEPTPSERQPRRSGAESRRRGTSVEQQPQEQPARRSRRTEGAAESAPHDDPISGEWSVRLLAEGMPPDRSEFTMSLKLGSGGAVTGTTQSAMGDADVSDGKYDPASNRITFLVERGPMVLEFNATVRGGKMTGDVDAGGMFGFEFEATRTGAAAAQSPESPAAAEPVVANARPLGEFMPGPRWVSGIETSRAKDGRVYVTFDGHRSDDDAPYVFASEDAGKTWRPLRANLPDTAGSTRVIREDIVNPDVLYLGTEFGIWVSIDRGASWTKFNSNMPTVAIHEIAQHPTSGEIIAATHGRSVWILDVTALRQLTPQTVAAAATLYRPNAAIYWRPDPGRGGDNRRFVGQNPSPGAEIRYSFARRPRRAKLTISDVSGEVIRELEVTTEPGLHSARWDLRRTPEEGGGGPGGFGGRGGPGGPAGRAGGGQRGRAGGGGFAFGGRAMGRLVPSGTYLVSLMVDGQTMTERLNVETDPEYPDYRAWELDAQGFDADRMEFEAPRAERDAGPAADGD